MPQIESKTKRNILLILYIAVWITYSFRSAYSTGLSLRSLQYMYSDFILGDGIIWTAYILIGLVNLAVAMLVSNILMSVVISSTKRVFISKQDFRFIFFCALIANNLITGTVFFLCHINPVMYPLVASILDIITFVPIWTGAFFIMKKHYVPKDLASKTYISMMWPVLAYYAITFIFGLIASVI